MRFVDSRKNEMEILERFYREDKFHFIPIHGRRGIGKTRLVQEFINDKPAIYFLADSVAEREQLRNLGTLSKWNFSMNLFEPMFSTEITKISHFMQLSNIS